MKSLLKNLTLLFTVSAFAQVAPSDEKDWETSVVSIQVTSRTYNSFQPWAFGSDGVNKNGVIIEGDQILTTADGLSDATLIRLQKRGRGLWHDAKIVWIDFHANLALVEPQANGFFRGLEAIRISPSYPHKDDLSILRWRSGRLEKRKADFGKYAVHNAALSAVNHVHLHVDSDIKAAGWAEPVVSGDTVVGLTSSHRDQRSTVIPGAFIQSILTSLKENSYRGLGYFSFVWTPASNPDTLKHLNLPGAPRGALIVDVPKLTGRDPVLKLNDIIIEVDGHEIDIQGDYKDPDYGYLILENLSTRNRWAGDSVTLKLWREGAFVEVTYTLPSIEKAFDIVGPPTFDQAPEFHMVGGFIFQPLTDNFLRSFRRQPPFRLNHYRSEPASDSRSGRILLTQVLPDPHNLGYQNIQFLVLDAVNQRPCSTLDDLVEALEHPVGDVHLIEFAKGADLRKIVVAANGLEAATQRVLDRYGIPSASRRLSD